MAAPSYFWAIRNEIKLFILPVSVLAVRAEAGAALADHDTLYPVTAARALLFRAMGYCKLLVSMPRFTIGTAVVAYAGSPILYALLQYSNNGAVQMFYLRTGQAAGRPLRMNTGYKEGLIGIHVAYACNEPLVKHDRFNRCGVTFQKPAQDLRSKIIAQRLNPQSADDFFGMAGEIDCAEPAGVAEDQPAAIIHKEFKAYKRHFPTGVP